MRRCAALLSSLLILLTHQVCAQEKKSETGVRFLVYGNFTVPHGEFGSKVGSEAYRTRRNGFYFGDLVGLAKNGWGVGAEVYLPITGINGVDWVFGCQLLMNTPDVSTIQTMFQGDLGTATSVTVDFSPWYNLPVMTGLRYSQGLTDALDVYANVQAGINVSKEPNRTIAVGSVVAESTDFDAYVGFGYEAGVGIELFNKYNLSIRYLNLGTPAFVGTRTLSPQYFPTIVTLQSSILGDQRKVEMFQLILGVEL